MYNARKYFPVLLMATKALFNSLWSNHKFFPEHYPIKINELSQLAHDCNLAQVAENILSRGSTSQTE